MECTACDGEGCKKCDGSGRIEIASCPKMMVDRLAWDCITMCDFAENGTWPVSGGVMDQTVWFRNIMLVVSSENNYWKNKQAEKQ